MQSLPLSKDWLDYFMGLAKAISIKSKDPSTKVGSLIVRQNRTIASTGYNGYPIGCSDENYSDREFKYRRIVHAEMNAILSAREPLDGYTIFSWPLPPCDRCIPHIVQAGIERIVIPKIPPDHRWAESCAQAKDLALEAGLIVVTWDENEQG